MLHAEHRVTQRCQEEEVGSEDKQQQRDTMHQGFELTPNPAVPHMDGLELLYKVLGLDGHHTCKEELIDIQDGV